MIRWLVFEILGVQLGEMLLEIDLYIYEISLNIISYKI
jgi:hypothetical protein